MNTVKNHIVVYINRLGELIQSWDFPGLYTQQEANDIANKYKVDRSTYLAKRVLPKSEDPIEILKSVNEYLRDVLFCEWEALQIIQQAVADCLTKQSPGYYIEFNHHTEEWRRSQTYPLQYSYRKSAELIEAEYRNGKGSCFRAVPIRDDSNATKVKSTSKKIDFGAAERSVLSGAINNRDIQRLLPFQTTLLKGDNHVHIVNKSAYVIETNSHFVREGATLCARSKTFGRNAKFTVDVDGLICRVNFPSVATCPGCLAKAKAFIVNYIGSQDVK